MTGPSFRFRLERVRALRERREDMARLALAQAISQRGSSLEHLRSVEAHLEHARAQQRLDGAASGAELQARQAFVERVEAQRQEGARELARQEAQVADRGVELNVIARERHMLERLKARQQGEHLREAQRREGSLLDEIALDRFRRSAA